MWRNSFFLVCLCVILGCGGCAIVRRVSLASEEKLRLQNPHPERYTVRVAGQSSTNDFAISSDGRVVIAVPGMGPGCTSYLFGLRGLPVNDQSPYTWRVVHVMQGTEVVRSLSLKQIEHLRMGPDGCRLLEVD